MRLSSEQKTRLWVKRAQRDALARRLADVTARPAAVLRQTDLDRDAVWALSGRQGVLRAAISVIEHEMRTLKRGEYVAEVTR